MDVPLEVNKEDREKWAEIAHGARFNRYFLFGVGDPGPGSSFAAINKYYPWEKASDWCREYLVAANQHLALWADHAAPLKYHPEHVVRHDLRPVQTLARAAIEAAAQAVWVMGGSSAKECATRHLRLVRWDIEEQRKAAPESEKQRFKDADAELLKRVSGDSQAQEWKRLTTYLEVLRWAAKDIGYDPDEAETLWRASSGAAHGKRWPALALQHVIRGEEYEPGQHRTIRVPDPKAMTVVLQLAERLTSHAAIKFGQFSGLDQAAILARCHESMQDVLREMPLKEGVERDEVMGELSIGRMRRELDEIQSRDGEPRPNGGD